ncbi:MAG TPA: acyltransferase family protein [Candidatus Limnocylindrales bacterium]|nr:acyltransferase family protein [Candidatus Limnocylindrales bacterium]
MSVVTSMAAHASTAPAAGRGHVHWVDWLKVLAVLGVFYYHSAMPFVLAPWMITNQDRSVVLTVIAGTGFYFGMPLLFLLSGAASSFAVRSRTTAAFLRLRFTRLVIPMIAGFLILSPIQAYFVLASKGTAEPLWQYYPHFFTTMQWFWNPRWFGTYGYHLWFLAFLFLYSVLIVPLIVLARRPDGRRSLSRFADLCDRPLGLLLFVVPLVLVQIALRARFPWYQDWTDFLYLFVFFACGYVILTQPRFEDIIARRAGALFRFALGLAVLFTLVTGPDLIRHWELTPSFSVGWVAYQVVRTTGIWALVVALLAFGIRHLDYRTRLLDYASEAVMPFYVLHHPVIVVIGSFVLQANANLWVKHAVLTTTALACTLVIYELGVRRFAPMRWFFGMRPLPRPARPAEPITPVRLALGGSHA